MGVPGLRQSRMFAESSYQVKVTELLKFRHAGSLWKRMKLPAILCVNPQDLWREDKVFLRLIEIAQVPHWLYRKLKALVRWDNWQHGRLKVYGYPKNLKLSVYCLLSRKLIRVYAEDRLGCRFIFRLKAEDTSLVGNGINFGVKKQPTYSGAQMFATIRMKNVLNKKM